MKSLARRLPKRFILVWGSGSKKRPQAISQVLTSSWIRRGSLFHGLPLLSAMRRCVEYASSASLENTQPNKSSKVNPGATVNVCAGNVQKVMALLVFRMGCICGGRVVQRTCHPDFTPHPWQEASLHRHGRERSKYSRLQNGPAS